MTSKGKENGHVHNHIAIDTKITGDINSKGDLRVDGQISGTVITEGKIVVGPDGRVEGTIKCKNANISGVISANLEVAELIVLKDTAKIKGDILTKKISIEPGAEFTGNCKMGNESSTTTMDGKRQKKG